MLDYTDYDTRAIPKRIRAAMKHCKMTRRELAGAMGYGDAGSISQYLVEIPTNPAKQRVPNLETLCKFANALNCDLEYLLGVLPEGVYHRPNYDVMKVTGLSEKAVEKIRNIHSERPIYLDALSALIESQRFKYFIACVASYPVANKEKTVKSTWFAKAEIPEDEVQRITAQNELAAIMLEMKLTCPLRSNYADYIRQWCEFLSDDADMDDEALSRQQDLIHYLEQLGVDIRKYYRGYKQEISQSTSETDNK